MTTRRDVLTGPAAAPVLPVLPGVNTGTDAQPVPARAVALAEPGPAFLHEIDGRLWRELQIVEQALDRVKSRLLAANHPDPMIRSGALLDMRCSFQTLASSAEWAGEIVPAQREHADTAARAWKAAEEPGA